MTSVRPGAYSLRSRSKERNAAEAVHEALLVEPRLVVGRDELDVAEGAQRTASERY